MTTAEILKARARELARRPNPTPVDGEGLNVVEFRLAGERYAIERADIREVIPLKELTPVPCTPPFVRGIVNVRGQIVPVIDMKQFFDLPAGGIADVHMVILVQSQGVELGIEADAVTGVRTIARGTMQGSLPTLNGVRAQYLRGVTDQNVAILDIAKILGDPRIVVNEQSAAIN
jgi:purine-binding chemotaxis protein CheW